MLPHRTFHNLCAYLNDEARRLNQVPSSTSTITDRRD